MATPHWIRSLFPKTAAPIRKNQTKQPARRLAVTELEDRVTPTIITVNDDGGADFTTIQDAINAATAGDTISVMPGTYAAATIDRSLTLVSTAGKATTIINGAGVNQGAALRVEGNVQNVTIGSGPGTGFTLNATAGDLAALYVVENNDSTSVSGNALSGGTTHALLTGGRQDNVSFSDNAFTGGGTTPLAYINGEASLGPTQASSNVDLVNNTFTSVAGTGLIVGQEAAASDVTGNTFSGPNSFAQLELFGADGTVTGNAFNGAAGLAIADSANAYLEATLAANNSFTPGFVYNTARNNVYTSIQQTINAAMSGDTVVVGAGTFRELVDINIPLTLKGANAGNSAQGATNRAARVAPTILAPLATGDAVGLRVNSTAGGSTVDGFDFLGAGLVGGQLAQVQVFAPNFTYKNNFSNSQLSDPYQFAGLNAIGLLSGIGTNFNNLLIEDSFFARQQSGVFLNPSNAVTAITIQDNEFASRTGVNSDISNSGHVWNSALVYNLTGNTIAPTTVDGSPFGPVTGINVGEVVPGMTVNISNNTLSTAFSGVTLGNASPFAPVGAGGNVSFTGNTFADSVVSPTARGIFVRAAVAGANITNSGNTFRNSLFVVNQTPAGLNISADSGNLGSGDFAFATASPTQLFGSADRVIDAIDISGRGHVRLKAGNVYVTPNSFVSPLTTTPSLNRAVAVAASGDTVNIQAGSYTDSTVSITQTSLTLQGPSGGGATTSGSLSATGTGTLSVNDLAFAGATVSTYANFNLGSTSSTAGTYTVNGNTFSRAGDQPTGSISFTAVANVGVSGGSGADTFNVSSVSGGPVYTLDGNDPPTAPGDTLNYDANGVSPAVGGGTITASGRTAVNYADIETIVVSDTGAFTLTGGGGDDDVTVRKTAANVGGAGGDLEYRFGTGPWIVLADPTAFTFDGGDGNDRLTVDFVNGSISQPVTFNGQGQTSTPGDTLRVFGGMTTSQTFAFTNDSDGSVTLAGTLAGSIAYTGLEPITSTVTAATVVLNYSGASETISVTADGAQTKVDSTAGEVVSFVNPTDLLEINAGGGTDTVTVTSFGSGFNAALDIDGQGDAGDIINLNAAVTYAAGKGLTLAAETISIAAAQTLSGSGTVSAVAGRNISVTGAISTGNGNILLDSDTGAQVAGDFIGVNIGASVTSTGGTVAVEGRGGDTGANQRGVQVRDGAVVSGGAGTTVTGFGGTGGTGAGSYGVFAVSGGRITSGGSGSVLVSGTGGTGAGGSGIGVYVLNTGSQITSGGTGTVGVTGVGGASAGNGNFGVLADAGGQITSGGGNVTVQGTGGGAGGSVTNYGVYVVAGGQITAGTGGTVGVSGTGGTGADGSSIGVYVTGTGSLAGGTTLAVTGNRGAGTAAGILSDSGTLSSTGLATLSSTNGSNVQLDPGATVHFGSLTVTTAGSATVFEDSATVLAGGNVTGTFALTSVGGVTQTAAVTAGSLSASNSGSGGIDLSTFANPVSTFTASNTFATGAVSVQLAAGATITGITSTNGAVTVSNPATTGVNLNGTISTGGGGVSFLTNGSAVTLTGNSSITTSGGNVSVARNILASAAGDNRQLTISAGAGTISLQAVGNSGTTRLGTFTATGSTVTVGEVRTGNSTGTQITGSTAVNLGGNLTNTNGAPISISGPTTLTAAVVASTTSTGTILFTGTIDGGQSLTLTTSTGTIGVTGSIGGTTRLTSLTTNGTGLTTLGGTVVQTTGGQTFNTPVSVTAAGTTFDSSGSSNIAFNSTLNGASAVTVNTGGTTTFGGAVGTGTALASLATNAGGTTQINGGQVSTAGDQTYGDNATLGGAGTTVDLNGDDIVFNGTLVGGSKNLQVSGNAVFGDAAGDTVTGLGTLTVTGTTTVNTSTVTSAGAQNYQGGLTIGAAAGTATLSTTNSDVTVGITSPPAPTAVPADTTLNGNLTVNAGSGNVTFLGTVNGPFALTVNSSGLTTFGNVGDTAPLTSLTTDAGGSTLLLGETVRTSGTQLYQDNVALLLGNYVLTGSTVTFLGTVTNAFQAFSLSIMGNAVFGDQPTDTVSIGSLDVSGTTAINTSSISTGVNSQVYGGTVTLGTDTTLTAGAVKFNGNVAGGGFDLTITGNADIGDAAADALTEVDALSVSGATAVRAGTVTATSQTYTGNVMVVNSSTLTATTLTANATLPPLLTNVTVSTGQTLTVSINTGGTGTIGTIDGVAGTALVKEGPGRLDITGSSTGMLGTTTANAGTLRVNGNLGNSATTVNAASLQGTGTVGPLLVNAGGTVAPGDGSLSIGTLFVNGSAAFAAGSFLVFEASAASVLDRLAATGNVMLNGDPMMGGMPVLTTVSLIGGYTPMAEDTLAFITSMGGTVTQTNHQVNNQPAPPGGFVFVPQVAPNTGFHVRYNLSALVGFSGSFVLIANKAPTVTLAPGNPTTGIILPPTGGTPFPLNASFFDERDTPSGRVYDYAWQVFDSANTDVTAARTEGPFMGTVAYAPSADPTGVQPQAVPTYQFAPRYTAPVPPAPTGLLLPPNPTAFEAGRYTYTVSVTEPDDFGNLTTTTPPGQFDVSPEILAITPITVNATNPAVYYLTNQSVVSYRVTFSDPVGGLTADNLDALYTGGLMAPTGPEIVAASVVGVPGTDPFGGGRFFQWDVKVDTGSGDGTLELELDDVTGLTGKDGVAVLLDEPFVGNPYTLDRTAPTISSYELKYGPSGTPKYFQLANTGRRELPWNITGAKALFSENATSLNRSVIDFYGVSVITAPDAPTNNLGLDVTLRTPNPGVLPTGLPGLLTEDEGGFGVTMSDRFDWAFSNAIEVAAARFTLDGSTRYVRDLAGNTVTFGSGMFEQFDKIGQGLPLTAYKVLPGYDVNIVRGDINGNRSTQSIDQQRLQIIINALAPAMGAIPTTFPTVPPTQAVLYDVYKDGVLNKTDLLYFDVTGDGFITSADMTALLQRMSRFVGMLPLPGTTPALIPPQTP